MKNGACVFHPCGRGSLRLQTSWLGGRSSGAANRLGLVATRPSAARGLEGRACVGNASICVFKSQGSRVKVTVWQSKVCIVCFSFAVARKCDLNLHPKSLCSVTTNCFVSAAHTPATIVSVLSVSTVQFFLREGLLCLCTDLWLFLPATADEVFLSMDPVNGCEENL